MTEYIATPASCTRRRTVAVLGAGIAGLTAAHELAERGFDVTVYEPRADERRGLTDQPPECIPPVKLGGLAASQYSTPGPYTGSLAQLRPFPGRRGQPRDPERAVAGEHGFRFFPAYYLHIWDLFQRIPVYQRIDLGHGEIRWQPTSRTIMDNVRRVVTQGTTIEGKPSLVFPRELPRTPAELLTTAAQLTQLDITAEDVQIFTGRLMEYLTTSPPRRAATLHNLSAYDYFIGRDHPGGPRRYTYSARFDALLLEMPRVLAAFDTHWGDARTNLSTYLQLQMQMDRRDNKADGVLNGPTTESWFDHWYRHLVELGVRFVHSGVTCLEPAPRDPNPPPHLRPRVRVTLADGTRLSPDYVVVAVDAPAAERITAAMRKAGTGGTVAGLDGFTTSAPPPQGPLQPAATRPVTRRDPYSMDDMGRVAWDRFQTLGGIQYYFDTEFQLLRGHMYYSGTEWALSSINQHGLWERRPILGRDGHVSVLSVDIGDFNSRSRVLKDENGNGKRARDCTADEIAAEVWRQIAFALTNSVPNVAESLLPWPVWYAIDRGIIMAGGPGQGDGRPIRNETPYLVPIIGDWDNRPGTDPWNPNGTSWTTKPSRRYWLANLQQRNVFQARHGGYQVHDNSVVFAGTWTKTFTRMTSMEAACESARHAVNAILDHYIWVESGGTDDREKTTIKWRSPYGFLDQGLTIPVRMPSPAGDYCYVVDMENREPLDTRPLRNFDAERHRKKRPTPPTMDGLLPGLANSAAAQSTGGTMTSPLDYNRHLLAYLQAWRQLLEASAAMTSALPFPPAPVGTPPTPPIPGMTPGASPPADYPQQLFSHLQAWRHYLEQSIAASQPPTPTAPGGGGSQQAEPAPPDQPGFRDNTSSGSHSTKIDPDEYLHPPEHGYGSGIDAFARGPISNMRLQGPEDRYASAAPPVNTAFGQKMRNIAADITPQMTTRSLYFNRGAEQPMAAPSTRPDVRFAAPPPASRWWKAGQGTASRMGDRVRAEDIIDVPPIQ